MSKVTFFLFKDIKKITDFDSYSEWNVMKSERLLQDCKTIHNMLNNKKNYLFRIVLYSE